MYNSRPTAYEKETVSPMKKNGLTFLITTLVLALFYILTGAFAASSAKMPKSVYSTVEARTSSGGEPLSNKTSNVVLDLGDVQVNKIYAFVGEVRSWHTDEKDGDYINLVFDFGTRSDSFLEGGIYDSRIGANKENRIYLNGRTNLYRWIKIYDGGEKTVGFDRVRFHTSDDTDVAELAFLDKKGKLISASIVQHSSFEGEKNYGGLIDEQAYFSSSQSKAYNFTDKELDEISAINAIFRGEKFVGQGFLNTLLNVVGTKIFGVNTFGLRFFSMLAGFASLLLVYYIVEMLFGRSEISALATLLALCSGQIFSASLTAYGSVSACFTIAAFAFAIKFFIDDYDMKYGRDGVKNLCFTGLFYGLALASDRSALTTVTGIIAILIFAAIRAKKQFKTQEKEAKGLEKENVYMAYRKGRVTFWIAIPLCLIVLPIAVTLISAAFFSGFLKATYGGGFVSSLLKYYGGAFSFGYALNPFGLLIGLGSDDLGKGYYAFANYITGGLFVLSAAALILLAVFGKKSKRLGYASKKIVNRSKMVISALVATLLPVFFGNSSVIGFAAASAFCSATTALAFFAAEKAYGKKAIITFAVVTGLSFVTFATGYIGYTGIAVSLAAKNILYGWQI